MLPAAFHKYISEQFRRNEESGCKAGRPLQSEGADAQSKITCYYDGPILLAQSRAQLSAEQAVKASKADHAGLEKVRF